MPTARTAERRPVPRGCAARPTWIIRGFCGGTEVCSFRLGAGLAARPAAAIRVAREIPEKAALFDALPADAVWRAFPDPEYGRALDAALDAAGT